MGLVDKIRRRLSVSPSPSSSIRKHDASFSGLTREEINEILESPYETNYTYSESVAYKPHIGSREYIHPRLCRRFPATPSPKPISPYPVVSNTWERFQSYNFSQQCLHMLRFIIIFSFTAVQFAFIQTFSYASRISRFIIVNLLYYTIFAPILAPYYALRSYWYRAKFVWKTSQNISTFVRWTWLWWTGQGHTEHDEFSVGVQTRSMASRGGRSTNVQRKIVHEITHKRSNMIWIFLYIPLLFLLIWAGYRMHHHWSADEKGTTTILVEQSNDGQLLPKNDEFGGISQNSLDKIPKIKPSEQFPPHLAHPIGGPSLNVQKEMELSQNNDSKLGDIGSPFLPRFYHFIQPISIFTEIIADYGHIMLHGIEDIIFAFFTVIGEIGSGIIGALKEIIIYIVQIPFRLFSFIRNWIFFPIWNKSSQIAIQISYFPRQFWNFIIDWIFIPIGNIASKIGSESQKSIVGIPSKIWHLFSDWFLTPISQFCANLISIFVNFSKNAAQFIAKIPSAILSFLQNWLFSPMIKFGNWIISFLGKFPNLMSNSMNEYFTICKNGIINSMEWTKNKIINLWEFIKNSTIQCFSSFIQFSKWIGQILMNSIFYIKNFILEMVLNGFEFIGWTGGKMIDFILWLQNGFINLIGQIWDGIQFYSIKVFEYFTNFMEFCFEKCGEFYQSIFEFVWWTVKKVNNFVIFVIKSSAQFFVNIFQITTNTIQNIWQNAKQFEFPKSPFQKQKFEQENQIIEPIENVLSRSPELGEMPEDHPFLKRIRQIVLQALNEERHFVDYRIRKWVEHNVLVMKSQLQKMEPKLVKEAKEKVEADILPPPPQSDEQFKEEMMGEMERKMQELMEKERIGQENKLEYFEGQIDEKIHEFITKLSSEIRIHNSQIGKEIDEMKKEQKNFEELNKKEMEKMRKKEEFEPIIKQEIITEKNPNGKEITKESTVLLQNTQQKIEEFDENALMERIRRFVKLELRRYDADRTGMPDYALESSGGSVLSTRCTVQYNERSRTQKLFGIPLWYTSYSPRTVIQRKGYGASAGECWAYYGGHGFLTIGLSKRINITAVSYEHLPVELSPDGHIRTAPKDFLIWSYQEVDDMNSRLLLGNFTYNAQRGSDPLQIFPVQKWDPRFSQILELETLTNWGAPVTCLYRFRVHGDLMKVIPEATDDAEFEALEAQHLSSAAHKSAKSIAEEPDRFK